MVNSKGYRRGTRYLFSKSFGRNGVEPLTTFLRVYRVGDIVDIKGNGAFQAGMPHKFYHGKTGRVFNVTKRGLGIIVNKRVRTRIMPKRINVRVEHVKPSKCRQDFLDRVKENDRLKHEARLKKEIVSVKRKPVEPAKAHFVRVTKQNNPEWITPVAYELMA